MYLFAAASHSESTLLLVCRTIFPHFLQALSCGSFSMHTCMFNRLGPTHAHQPPVHNHSHAHHSCTHHHRTHHPVTHRLYTTTQAPTTQAPTTQAPCYLRASPPEEVEERHFFGARRPHQHRHLVLVGDRDLKGAQVSVGRHQRRLQSKTNLKGTIGLRALRATQRLLRNNFHEDPSQLSFNEHAPSSASRLIYSRCTAAASTAPRRSASGPGFES